MVVGKFRNKVNKNMNTNWSCDVQLALKYLQKQPPGGLLRKGVLRNFAKFTGRHLYQSLFFNKVAGLPKLLFSMEITHEHNTFGNYIFFCKQPVYKQLALGWLIAKQLSGLNPFSLRKNKNYKLKKVVKPTIHKSSAV